MRRSTRFLSAITLLAVIITPLQADPIQMARTPAISPAGKEVAFSYLGDIWIVSTEGGNARHVTLHQAHEINPIFSPDGKQLAFASRRHGSYDVFITSALGGRPTRLTFDSADDFPTAWSPDGKTILFRSNRSPEYPKNSQLFTISSEGGAVKQITHAGAREGSFSPDGKEIAYVGGPGKWYRRNYRGSSDSDVWICDSKGKDHRLLTPFDGNDSSPRWDQEGNFIYYVSGVFGKAPNLVRCNADGKGKPELVTVDKNGEPFHVEEGIRHAQISANGAWVVYSAGPDLWIVSSKPGSEPKQLKIEAYADEKTNRRAQQTFTTGASEFALSPRDEKHFALVVRGEIFLQQVGSSSSATRLTHHRANDHGVAWAPDSSKIFFLSDRSGQEEVYCLEEDDPNTGTFTRAKKFKATHLPNTNGASGLMVAPNGSLVTFLRQGKLWSCKPDGKDLKVMVDEQKIVDYEWSPDSRWVVYAKMDGSFSTDLFVQRATGGNAVNVTRYATTNVGVTWSQRGHRLSFLSDRSKDGLSLFVLALQKTALPGSPPSSNLDLEDAYLRVGQPAKMEVKSGAISMTGGSVAFAAANEGKEELWLASASGSSVRKITSDGAKPRQIRWSRRSSNSLSFRDAKGQFRMMRVSAVPGQSPKATVAVVPFKAEMVIDAYEEYAEMLEQSWRYLADNFYDEKMHGVDWNKVRERYRPRVKHIAKKEDLYALIYLMLGELNASHLGVSGYKTKPEETTAHLGMIFDETYRGRGLKVKEVLKLGPADQRGEPIKPGDLVIGINGKALTSRTNLSEVLNNKEKTLVELAVTNRAAALLSEPSKYRRVKIVPTSTSNAYKLFYRRWIDNNAKKVEEMSGGKLGYVHVPSMNESGVRHFVRSLYSDNFKKEGLILDLRFNGGGNTHDQILSYLGSRAHTVFRHRDGGEGLVLRSLDRKWTKPVTLLINNRSFSDAEIFPNAFRTLELGKIVGVSTGGHVIGTGSVKLIDGSTFRLPRVGVFTSQGINMEKKGVEPDVMVEMHPNALAEGRDEQLKKAVEVLKEDVDAWKTSQKEATSQK